MNYSIAQYDNYNNGNSNDKTIVYIIKYVSITLLFLQFSVFCYKISNKIKDMTTNDDDTCSDTDTDADTNTEDDNIKVSPLTPYEEKYMDKLQKLPDMTRELTETDMDNFANTYVMEMTPVGNVIMFWNNKKGTFTFYADSTIPYRFLEVVARKYVIQNQCKQLYISSIDVIDTNIENNLSISAAEKTEEENNDKLEEIKENIVVRRDVFAKLKKYNTSTIHNVKALQKRNITSSSASVTKDRNQGHGEVNMREIKNNVLIKEKVNRYTCEGKIVNFSFLKKDKKIGQKISFAEYKYIYNSY